MSMTYPIQLPGAPTMATIRWAHETAVAGVMSPFDFTMQTQGWPAQRAVADLILPRMGYAAGRDWAGWLLSLNGREGTFLVADPDYKRPLGSAAGTPVVAGAVSARATTLPTRGWQASAKGVLLRGALIQLGGDDTPRMHWVLRDADADGSGAAALDLFPMIRADQADGAAVEIWRPRGLFRLSQNTNTWETDPQRVMQGLSLAIEEAL